MDVLLTPELEQFVREQIRTGRYHDAGEVICESLRRLKEQDRSDQQKLQDLRREIQVGIDAADRGETREFDDALLEEIERDGRAMLAANQKAPR